MTHTSSTNTRLAPDPVTCTKMEPVPVSALASGGGPGSGGGGTGEGGGGPAAAINAAIRSDAAVSAAGARASAGAGGPAPTQPTAPTTASGGGEGGGGTGTTTTSTAGRILDDGPVQKVSDEALIKKIVNQAVQDIIQDEPYSHEATRIWTNKIVEKLVRTLVQIDRDNKYIVTCMIVQNLRQGMRSATSCFWNAQTDSGYSLTYVSLSLYLSIPLFPPPSYDESRCSFSTNFHRIFLTFAAI